MSVPQGLPFLPGTSFDSPSARSSLRKAQTLTFENGGRSVSHDRSSSQPLSTSMYPKTAGKGQLPAWIAFDRQVLRFEAFFREAVHERREEQFRIRKCTVLFYLEDDTIQVNEPVQDNSGLPQGTFIRRHRIPKPAPNDDQFFTVADLNNGSEICLYGRTFRLVSCDKFTENFLTKLGVVVSAPEAFPEDSYTSLRQAQSATMVPNRPYEVKDTLRQFLERDRQVLRFYGLWDDSSSLFGDRRKFVLHYYLADDTIEVLESLAPNCGRDAPSVFLKRQKLPMVPTPVPLPGAKTDRTVLNVFGPMGHGGRHILDSLQTGALKTPFYREEHLQLGAVVNVFGRAVTLCDCDDFTKTYYRTKYGVEDFTPIPFPDESKPGAPREVPPYNGFGSEDDSLANCKDLIPKPPKKDLAKFFDKETLGIESEVLRFQARFDTTKPIDLDRRFLITYFAVDDTLSVFETPQRNSGIDAGKFLQQSKYKVPDGSRHFSAEDFFIGARVEINKFKFVLIDADEYALLWMEKHDFPYSNADRIVSKLSKALAGKREELQAALNKADTTGTGAVPIGRFTLVLNRLAPVPLNDHEVRTLVRRFNSEPPVEKDYSVFAVQIREAMRKNNWDKFESLTDVFLHHDRDRKGYLDRNDFMAVCHEYNVPVTYAAIDSLLAVIDPSGAGKSIDFNTFVRLFDWRSAQIDELLPHAHRSHAQDQFAKTLQQTHLNHRAPSREQSVSIDALLSGLFGY